MPQTTILIRLSVLLTLLSNFSTIIIKQALCDKHSSLESTRPDFYEVTQDYRKLFYKKSYYHLNSAGLLNHSTSSSDEFSEDLELLKRESFSFDSNDFIRKSIVWQAFAAGADRTARHVYDDQNDIKLAAGPQVDQRWCKLHLDYMLHMVDKHHKHVTRSTEMSIFNIMNSFGSPSLGFASGNPIFPGDYRACIENKLNVIKRELVQVNEQEAEEYFNQMRVQREESSPGVVKKMLQTSIYYIAKLVGYVDRNVGDNQELIKKHNDKLQLVPTRYCWAALRWPNWPNSTYYKRNLVLRSATCLPDTCDSRSIELYHDKIKRLSELQMPEYFKGYYISHLYCLPDENSELRNPMKDTKTALFIHFNVIWYSLIAIATLLNYFNAEIFESSVDRADYRSSVWIRFLSYWCLTKNVRDFWSPSEKTTPVDSTAKEECKSVNDRAVDLTSLEGLKVVASFAVISSHGLVLDLATAWNANHVHSIMSTSLLASVSSICPSSVDCFFVMTGVLTSMGLMRISRKTLETPLFWLKFFILRYVRIVPYYLLVHWALQAVSRFVASGPFWDYCTSDTSWCRICQKDSLWNVVFLSANYKSPLNHCNPVGWYLANDLQFSLVTPFIILLYLKKPIMGHLTVFTTCFAVMANHIKYYYDQPVGRGGLEFSAMTINYILKDASAGYTNPQYRCLAYFIGLATGQLLHQYEQGHIRQWPRGFVSACKIVIWSVIYILCAGPYITLMFPLDNNKSLVHLVGAIVGGTIHGVTSFGVAALIVLLCTGNLPTINHVLSLKTFQRLARASLSTVLIQISVIAYHTHTQRIPAEISVHNVVTSNFIWTIESLVASIAIHLIYELPLRKFVTKLLMTLISSKKPVLDDSSEKQPAEKTTSNKIKSY